MRVSLMFAVALSAISVPVLSAWAQDPASPVQGAQGLFGGLMNPEISLDGLFALSQFNRDVPLVYGGGHDPQVNGFNLQQVELTFGSNVDHYFRGDANLVFTKEGVEVEEAYATTLDFPANLQLKGGQFFTAFGRLNPVHPHAWDWADKPLVLGRDFGGDGLRNVGAQLSWLTPLPWYSELIGSVQNSNGDTAPSFLGAHATGGYETTEDHGVQPITEESQEMRTLSNALILGRWNNFVPVTEKLSMNLGASYVEGSNSMENATRTKIVGGDLFLKYRDPGELSFITLQAEAMERIYGTLDGNLVDWGWYAQINYRLPEGWERWHVGLRYDFEGPRSAPVVTVSEQDLAAGLTDSSSRYRISPVVTFYPTEFSKVRFQYNYDKPQNFETAQQVGIVQLEFMMGAHGAHKF